MSRNANLEAQIANPSVAEFERNKLRSYQNFQRKCLVDAQTNLSDSQKKLAELTGGREPPKETLFSSEKTLDLSKPHVVPTNRPIRRSD
jgi:hypothetical protein